MSKTIKTHLFANTSVWILSPSLLYKMAKKFRSMSSNFRIDEFEKYLPLKNLKRTPPNNDSICLLNTNLRTKFREKLFQLKLGDDENKDVVVHATLIAMLIHTKGADYLADVTPVKRGSQAEGDFIVSYYLKYGIDDLRIALRTIDARKPKSYYYYVPQKDLFLANAVPKEPDASLLSNVQTYLSKYFEKEYKSALCDIATGRVDKLFYIDISHAGPCIHGEQVEPETTKVADYLVQPVVYDTLIFDLNHGDLRVHMDSNRKSVINEYIKVVGDLFFENKKFWGESDKYTLAPLNSATGQDVRKLLQIANAQKYISMPNSKLTSLELRRLVYSKKNSQDKKEKITRASEACISTDLEDGLRLLPMEYNLDNVMFSIGFQSNSGTCYSLNMNLHKNRRSYEGNIGCDGLDEWLDISGFIAPVPKNGYAGSIPEWFEKMEDKQVKVEAKAVEVDNMVTNDEDTFKLSN